MDSGSRWWLTEAFDEGAIGRWSLGPLVLIAERKPFEWCLSWSARRDPALSTLKFEGALLEAQHELQSDVCRFGLSGHAEKLTFNPRLADRAVVTRPATPFTVLGGSTVNVFVTTPLWLEVSLPLDGVLIDVPTLRLSDTWFGASPRSGHLCYASRTRARLDPKRLMYHPVRAITRISISNGLSEPWLVERVKIPAPNLSLFIDQDDHLWTQAVHVERHTANQPSKIWFETPSLLISDTVELVTPAREPVVEGLLERAVQRLIG